MKTKTHTSHLPENKANHGHIYNKYKDEKEMNHEHISKKKVANENYTTGVWNVNYFKGSITGND